MSNSVAEAYLLIVRESNVPIIGEAVPHPFTGQIELDAWTWDIKNAEQLRKHRKQDRFDNRARRDKVAAREKKAEAAKKAAEAKSRTDTRLRAPSIRPETLISQIKTLQESNRGGQSQSQKDAEVRKRVLTAVTEYKDIAEEANEANEDKEKEDDPSDIDADDKKMKFTFEKGTDLATTPLLYALARGDLIRKAVLTLFHRATTTPVTLVITFADVRITKYTVSCEAGDYMSDVKETWEATYQSVDWMYQNRPAAAGLGRGTNLAQGQVRVFAMKSKFSKYSPI